MMKKELDIAIKASREAGNYLRDLDNIEVLTNREKDIKLKADKESEKIILKYLFKSDYPIISEETRSETPNTGLRWIVDPLDGSLNFSRRIPNCVVSIALWKGLEPILGVIYDFNRNDLYYGIVGEGASLNDKRISVSDVLDKENAIICTGFPSKADYSTENLLGIVKKIQDFKKIRLLGSAALSLAYVSSGKADAYHEKGIMLWDVAAGLALVKAAGGEYEVNTVNENQYNVFANNGKIKS